MTRTNNVPDVLELPWVLAEPVIMASPAAMLQAETIRAIDETPELTEPERRMRNWRAVAVVVTFVWAAVAAVLMMTGAVFPVRGNILAYLVMMVGLFCWAFLALAFPPDEKPETFWTLGSEPGGYGVAPVAQCSPSRAAFTGRQQ